MRTVATRSGRARRGQAVAELALVLPLLLAFAGIVVDFGRGYSAWIALESATRIAAESAAGDAMNSTEALTDARTIICAEMADVVGYVAGGTPSTCTQPNVTVPLFTRSSTAPGASAFYPLGSVTVEATLPFEMLMHWPWLDEGTWTLSASESFELLQGR